MGKKIGLALLLVVLVLVVVIATRPAAFKIERSIQVDAAPAFPYAVVNDFARWKEWSPWSQMDPNQKTEISSVSTGVGATYAWHGNDKVGEGKMTITDSKPGEQVVVRLEFQKPMTATNTATFEFRPLGTSTQVVWSMKGENGFVGKAFSMVMDMDKMVGGDFEKGLASVKTISEKDAKQAAEAQAQAQKAAATTPVTPPVAVPGTENP